MKIDFQSLDVNQNVDVEKTSKSTASSARKTDTESGYKVDISGIVMDNAAYGTEELKSAQEVMQDAGRTDVALQRNYMAVMSNSMSTEDFTKLQEEGYPPGSTTVETSVTILDKIKATLARAGVAVEGYTDDISDEQLEKITGSVSSAAMIKQKLWENDLPVTDENIGSIEQAANQVSTMTGLSDSMIKYMLSNDMEPTIDHLYKAEYSSANVGTSRQSKGYFTDSTGYYAKKADYIDWEQLDSQINKIIEDAGLEVNEETKANSRWLIEQGIPLTENTINELGELKKLSLPMDKEAVIDSIIAAISDGKEAKQALLTESESAIVQAQKIIGQTGQITEKAVNDVTEQGKDLTLQNLYEAQQAIEAEHSKMADKSTMSSSYEAVAAQRLLEETRLQMTIEANIKLLKSGYSIDTAPLEELVSKLKTAEQDYYNTLFGNHTENIEEKVSLYKRTISVLTGIQSLPAAVLGKMSTTGATFTLSHVYSEGVIQKAIYDKAGETYEALGTAPRKDMGDSISKAFQNVDTLLSEMNLEANETNRRAVRILGYNQMEINEESVQKVKEADQAVQRLIEKMTPAATLDMIRSGKNPLSTDIYQLTKEISEKTSLEETEKYSEYLWKLEKNQEITTEERAAYIGVYRLFHQIEKSDGGVIGTVLQNEQPLTLRNLLSAARSSKASGMDVTIDQDFGLLEAATGREDSISEQIDGYYETLAQEILDKLSPNKLQNMSFNMNTSMEAFAEDLRSAQEDAKMQQLYAREQLEEVKQANQAEDYVLNELLQYDQGITPDSILAKTVLMNQRGSTFRQILEQADQADDNVEGNESGFKEAFLKAGEQLQESMGDEASAKAAYEKLAESGEKILSERMDRQIYAVDVKSMNLLYKQLSVASSLAREGNYEVPIELNGEMTSINLRIIKDSDQKGRVDITMQTEEYGQVAAEFRIKNGKIEGYIASDSREGLSQLSQMDQSLRNLLQTEAQEVKNLNFIYSKELDINQFGQSRRQDSKRSEQTETSEKTGTKELYETAKAFIVALKQRGGSTYEN